MFHLVWWIDKTFGRTEINLQWHKPVNHDSLFKSNLRKIKNRKVSDHDEIPSEIWKTRKYDDFPLRYLNVVFNKSAIEWIAIIGITLTSIAAKVYNALLFNCITPEIEETLERIKRILEKAIHNITDSDNSSNHKSSCYKPWGDTLVRRFLQSIDSIHKEKMERILLAYGLPRETVRALMILYSNTKVKVRSTDVDTDFSGSVAGLQHGDTLAQYLFIISLDFFERRWI